jgi:hypothetical protein
MKRPVVFAVFISFGVFAAALILLAARFFDPLASFLNTVFLKEESGSAMMPFYVAVALILLAAGALISLVSIFFMDREDRKFYWSLKDTGGGGDPVYDEISRCLDSIDASITKLKESSEAMKINAGELNELSRWLGGEAEEPEPEIGEPETRSATLGNSVAADIRLIRPVDSLVPPGPSPLPQSHQKIWFFPRK